MNASKIAMVAAGLTLSVVNGLTRAAEENAQAHDERAVIESTIRASIGWALTKDRPLLESVMARDERLFLFQPNSANTVVGWTEFVKGFDIWMDPRFKATQFAIRDLRINLARSGGVAWWSCILDDLAEWEGRPVGWKDTRWTGVLEQREGRWVIVQMHFSFAADLVQAAVKEAATK